MLDMFLFWVKRHKNNYAVLIINGFRVPAIIPTRASENIMVVNHLIL